MRRYKNYKELLDSRNPTQLLKALEIQKRILREKEQEERMKRIIEKKIIDKMNFLIKINLVISNEEIQVQ